MSDPYAPDDERDALFNRLMQIPENKVQYFFIIIYERSVLIVKARIQNGHHPQ